MKVDLLTAARGAAAGTFLAVPAALANVVLSAQDADDRSAVLSIVTLLVLLLGFVLAGFAAGRLATFERARHGTAAALIVFVLIEVIAVLGRLDRGDGVSLGSILFTGLLAAAAGAAGGTLGARRPVTPSEP
ncbi:TIGR04086 family membrane protein [Aquihabitans sp. G128]|uniref:TIGR04086 family membrane protein n=1 Tax=Aquihabitans sp. G128 TaxID=2849779 RepID=UPI001C218A5F|nr:TIGR04086 family membrane protein [Aquihabitans sp. G128]QXC62341.1 TIGR04086 family membrane protein [Aquihabitans sp. G128]